MSATDEGRVEGPAAYGLALEAVEAMKRHGVWPTPLNFRLWTAYVADPGGPVAVQIDRLVKAGDAITEDRSLAIAQVLEGQPAQDDAPDVGRALDREMATVEVAIDAARRTSETYGASLEGATRELAGPKGAPALRTLLDSLAEDTRVVKAQHRTLEQKLNESTVEAVRLRDNLVKGRKEAITDALTGLPNRKAFDDALRTAWRAAAASGKPLSLAMIDIDNFKRFNDTWGHQTGDRVLRFVADTIGQAAAAPRFAGRFGGEEFAVIFVGEGLGPAMTCIEAVRKDVAAAVLKRRAGNEDLGAVTISAGVALLRPKESIDALVGRADRALYAAKSGGRNQVVPDDPAAASAPAAAEIDAA